MSFNFNSLNYNSSKAEATISASAATIIAVAGTYVKTAGTTTAGTLTNFTMPVNNRLTCTNTTPNKFYKVDVSGTFQTTAINNTLGIQLAKNGVLIASTIIENRADTSATPRVMTTSDIVQLSNTDYIEVWCANITAINNVTATLLSINIIELS